MAADAFGSLLTFPLKTDQELIDEFHCSFEVVITKNDFTQPCKKRWVHLFCFLLAHMTDNDVNDLMNNLQSLGEEFFDYPELYMESQLLIHVARFMSQALIHCKVTDFTIDDILYPTKKRLLHILSALMNYLCFRAIRKVEYDTIIQRMVSKVGQKDALEKKNKELVTEIEAIQKQLAKDSEAVAKVVSEFEVYSVRLEQLNKDNSIKKKAVDDVKLKIGKKQLDMQRKMERVLILVTEMGKIEEQIVTSPDRFEAEIRDQENRLSRLKKLQQERNAQLDKLKKLRNPELKTECRQALKEISAELEKEKRRQQMTSELTNVKGRVHDLQEGAETLQKEIQKQKLLNVNKQEKLEKLEVLHRHEEVDLEELLQKLMTEEKDLADELEMIQSERQSIQLKTAEVTKEHEANIKYMHEEYASLITTFEAYNQNVVTAFGNSVPDELRKA